MEENRSYISEPLCVTEDADAVSSCGAEDDAGYDTDPVGENGRDDREEYERLIKNRFKDFYAEDTQRLINRRFRKYKVMEERFKIMEDTLAEREAKLSENDAKIAEFDALLRSEIEKAVKETEERIIGEIRAKKLRPEENGTAPVRSPASFDVSRLTKSERASLAKRAAGGEKIKL